jgi:hypothetical protein
MLRSRVRKYHHQRCAPEFRPTAISAEDLIREPHLGDARWAIKREEQHIDLTLPCGAGDA